MTTDLSHFIKDSAAVTKRKPLFSRSEGHGAIPLCNPLFGEELVLREMAYFPGLLGLSLLLAGVHTSDVNWGKKVSCFVVDGTTVCPGCNYRAGLSCPRSLKNLPSCLKPPTTQVTETSVEETTEEIGVTETNDIDFNATTLDSNEFLKAPTRSPIDMAIFLYRILGSKLPNSRYKRQTQELGEVCNWNGDCPCPQICCKTGPECPKRCVMGIRLPPPWG